AAVRSRSLARRMAAQVIDGKAVAARVRAQVAEDVAAFTTEHGRPPGLATVLIGDDPGSAVYVGGKQRASKEVGIAGFDHRLPAANATVTVCHSRTHALPAVARRGDVLIAAVGRPEMVRGDWVKPGAVVIDVGINRLESGLVGDVAFAEAAEVARAITPVPGGVGAMTVACLLRNTLHAAKMAA